MPKSWKQSGAWGTLLGSDIFSRARLRLTILYVLIITVILFIFSQALLAGYGRYMARSVERHELAEKQEYSIIQEAERELQVILLLVNAGIILLTTGFGYFLAGRTLSPIKQTFENQKQFISDASHELRTPLAILKTNMEVELSLKKPLPLDYRKSLESNLEEVDTMAKLVNDLLLLSRLDAQQDTTRQPVVLGDLLQFTKKRMSAYAREHAVSLHLELPKPEIVVSGDKELIISAISNLLKNAIDYNKKNGLVSLKLEDNGRDAFVTIEDTGIGIPQDIIAHIFDRFYRGDKSRSGYISGAGLGLAIVKSIVDKHAGTITVKSRENMGTTMIIQLPLGSPS